MLDRTRLQVVGHAILIGIGVGIVVSSFRFLIEKSLKMWQLGYHWAHSNASVILVMIGLLLLIGVFIGKLLKNTPNAMGSGIPQVEGQLHGQLALKAWPILWRKYVTGILAIGTGAFLGREGPSIQLGASVGQLYAEKIKVNRPTWRLFVASGAAAGLAAAFNAPIAGTLFVLEEVYHSFSTLVWLSALTSALVADFIAHQIFGLQPVLRIIYVQSFPLNSYWLLLLMGLILGLLGYLYQIFLLHTDYFYRYFRMIPRQYHGIIALLLVIPIGWQFTDTLGGGNGLIQMLGKQTPGLLVLLGLFGLRFIFSMIAYGSGLPGGIFLPILALGALLGAIVGVGFVQIGWLSAEYIPNLIIMAMAGYFASISKAPFTAVLLITEMVGSLQHLLPLAVVSLVAYLVVDALGGAPIYESLLAKIVVPKQLATLRGQTDTVEIIINQPSHLAEKQVRDINWPKGALLVKIFRGEQELVPNGDLILQVGDRLEILTDDNQRSLVWQTMTKLN